MEEELSTILWRLSQNIVDIVVALKKNKQIRKVKRLWIHEKITNFEYKKGSVSWKATHEYFEKEEWDWRDEFRIVEPKIKEMPLYVDTYKRISDIYNTKETQAEYWLSQFAHHIVRKALYEDINEESLLKSVTIFVNDLERNPIIWNVLVELEGIWLREEEIKIHRGLKIRRPQPKDFEFEWAFEHIFIPRMQPLIGHLSAILEITQRAKFQPFVWDELEKLIIALRLYKLGSVARGKTVWKPKSILRFGGTTWTHFIQPTIYKYSLGTDDSSDLRNFLNKVTPLLPIKNGRIETIDHISISLQRYNDALFKGDPTERLTYGIMGLEALFLKASEREELAHRLAQRVAKCLSVLGQQPLETYRNIKRSYEVRSDFIHGSLITKERHQDISKLADEIVKYLRITLLMFLELKGKIEKEGLLGTVDNSLLHPKASVKLERLIKENCHLTQNVNVSIK